MCTHQEYWLITLVDDNGLRTVVVIPVTILLPETGIMLLSPQKMAQGYPINIKERNDCQAIVQNN